MMLENYENERTMMICLGNVIQKYIISCVKTHCPSDFLNKIVAIVEFRPYKLLRRRRRRHLSPSPSAKKYSSSFVLNMFPNGTCLSLIEIKLSRKRLVSRYVPCKIDIEMMILLRATLHVVVEFPNILP